MNNNDQQLNDNSFEENKMPTDVPLENAYEYVFSDGMANAQNSFEDTPDKKPRSQRRFFRICTAVLSLFLAFCAGFGGSVCASFFTDHLPNAAQNGGIKNLYVETPEVLIQQDPSEPSKFGSAGEDVFSVSQVADIVLDTVVIVNATLETQSFGGAIETRVRTGSGVIITQNGYIVTCHHVIDDAAKITVKLNYGEEYEAALVGFDENSDIALLYVDAQKALPSAKLGNSGDLVPGEMVVAVGNPLGQLYWTVTAGYISALDRNIANSDGTVMTLLQTDAAVNSGNSGGGLFNLDGELIGIVNAKYEQTGVEGLAFAIPIDWAYKVQLDLMKYGYVRGIADSGLTVVEVNQDNFYQYAYYYGVKTQGVYVIESQYCEDLRNKDLIVSVNGIEVSTSAQLNAVCKACKIGDTVEVLYSRDGNTYTTQLTLQEYVPEHIKNK